MTTLYYFSGACSLVPHIVARELGLDISAVAAPRPDDAGRYEYLDKINNGYLEYIKSQSDLNVLIIDVSDRDFVKKHEDYLFVLEEIKKKIV